MTKQPDLNVKEIADLEKVTLNAINKGQKTRVKILLNRAENVFIEGNEYTRLLVANKFILPLSQLLEVNYNWGREYLNLFPQQLKAEYCRQINSSGI